VRCVFPEELRNRIRDCLFHFVRVRGMLHYGPSSPFPYLIELIDVEATDERAESQHLSSGRGLFRESVYEADAHDWF
jgi:hypothetical protein